MAENAVSPACNMWKQLVSRSLKAGWGDAFFKDSRYCKGTELKDNLCTALCRNRKFLGGSAIHRELLSSVPVPDHNCMACLYICTYSLYAYRTTSGKLAVQAQDGACSVPG